MKNIENLEQRVNMKTGMISGFFASAISSIVLALLTSIAAIPDFNYIAIQGSIFGLTGAVFGAWVVYFIIGTFIWGNLYAVIEQRLGDSISQKGIMFGLMIWLIVMLLLMPIAGVGVFVKEYGFGAAGIILLTDLVFGLFTAHFYDAINKSRINKIQK